MAFMLPLAVGSVGGLSGFIAGYLYNYPSTLESDSATISESELSSLKLQSPHKELKEELVNFRIETLKKPVIESRMPSSDEQLLLEIHKKITDRRRSIV